MKLVIMSLVAFAAIGASAEQDLTGCIFSQDGKNARCLVTVPDEGSGHLAYITVKVRKGSSSTAEVGCPIGDASNGKCPTSVGIPKWLKDLNDLFPTPTETNVDPGAGAAGDGGN